MSQSTPAIKALESTKVTYVVHRYHHDPAVRNFGAEVASALGVEAASVFKTLIVSDGSKMAVALVPVTQELDLRAMAAALGVKSVTMADRASAERQTGYVIGGISPIGQKRRLPTVVDRTMLAWPTVYVSGGRRGIELELAPADLITVVAATVADLARS